MVLLSVKSIQGRREYMEDRYAYLEDKGIIIAMICDGHGGYQVAAETIKNLPQLILDALHKTQGNYVKHSEAIRSTIMNWGSDMRTHHSGSTLTGVVMKNDTIYIFNLGDSRTCMKLAPSTFIYMLKPSFNFRGVFMDRILVDYAQPQFFCTTDHDGESDEYTRVNSSGGKIVGKRLNGILSVTRALGDEDVGPGISYVPDVYWVKKERVIGPILMYSDGIYEPQRSNNVNFDDRNLYYIANRFNTDVLVTYAYNKGSDDNLTAMLVSFK
uniref:Protein phosphatase 2C n=1 Tax=Marseillevirus LCMAC201 TaxID=2506605 RepID=A0A481YXU4_9VIRU|nr:MAG: protein phosphatase 2C [Marseillevirus LCMAC201]